MKTKGVSENQDNYKRRAHNVGISMWHLQWCTKYRFNMFRQEKLRTFCEVAVKECCKRYGMEVIVLNVQPNHVHLVVELPRGMTDIRALNLLKGFSAFVLFQLVPDFRKRYPKGSLWSCGNFSATVGFAELETVVEYVRNQ